MEKIYMENEKKSKKKSFFNKFFNDKGSMTAFVVVAFVGILSLMVFGFKQISYAVDNLNSSLPNSFTSAVGPEMDPVISPVYGVDKDGNRFTYAGFYTDTGIPFICIEYNVNFVQNKNYSSTNTAITDNGLIYLMSKMYPAADKKFTYLYECTGLDECTGSFEVGDELPENVQLWLTQTAVWTYLSEIEDENNTNFAEKKSIVENTWKIEDSSGNIIVQSSSQSTLFSTYGIDELIDEAIQIHNSNQSLAELLIEKKSNAISVTNDNKYYQSDLVSVTAKTMTGISSFESYSVNLSDAPEGTILVDESGNVYDDVANMSPTSKFYVRIPVDKVTDENKNIGISILGNFEMYGANEYTSTGSQKVINVQILNRSFSKPLDIQLDYTPDVPDTGMSTAQIIYFIGLIVLLSGVGIIYANAKPQTSK